MHKIILVKYLNITCDINMYHIIFCDIVFFFLLFFLSENKTTNKLKTLTNYIYQMLGNIPFLPYSTNSMKVPLDEILNLQRVDESNTHMTTDT